MYSFVAFEHDFNPHSQEGSDTFKVAPSIISKVISIHTPKKGVTFQCSRCTRNSLFQSTLPRREWLFQSASAGIAGNFNPHSQEGSDGGDPMIVTVDKLFQSTLPRREWPWETIKNVVQTDFNPHSQEGSDDNRIPVTRQQHDFNPHSQEGSDVLDTDGLLTEQ